MVFTVLLVFTCGWKIQNFSEDDLGPAKRIFTRTAGLHYEHDVELGLTILAEVYPDKVDYLRKHGNPIEFIACSRGREGFTTLEDGVIHVCDRHRNRPAEIAVVLSHEITHLQRHDPDDQPPKHSFLRRVLWLTEEQYAHEQSLHTAIRLFPRYPSVWAAMGWQWPLEVFLIYASPFAVISLLALSTLVWSEGRSAKNQRALRPQTSRT